MDTQLMCEKELRELLHKDRGAFIREYRIVMNLHGEPSSSENATDDEMIRSICDSQPKDEAFKARRSQWEKTV
jgi:hypothetical protein